MAHATALCQRDDLFNINAGIVKSVCEVRPMLCACPLRLKRE